MFSLFTIRNSFCEWKWIFSCMILWTFEKYLFISIIKMIMSSHFDIDIDIKYIILRCYMSEFVTPIINLEIKRWQKNLVFNNPKFPNLFGHISALIIWNDRIQFLFFFNVTLFLCLVTMYYLVMNWCFIGILSKRKKKDITVPKSVERAAVKKYCAEFIGIFHTLALLYKLSKHKIII